jgi:hypothetical protein
MNKPTDSGSTDSQFFGLLFLLFLGLRLAGIIDWPWIWVFGPLWIPATIAIVGVLLIALSGGFKK